MLNSNSIGVFDPRDVKVMKCEGECGRQHEKRWILYVGSSALREYPTKKQATAAKKLISAVMK